MMRKKRPYPSKRGIPLTTIAELMGGVSYSTVRRHVYRRERELGKTLNPIEIGKLVYDYLDWKRNREIDELIAREYFL
jgi:hypothetical protein